jgi:hypothetical protein
MASIRKEIHTSAQPGDVWAALRDVGALHSRLVPGFVTNTQMDGDARIVTFGNGTVLRENIVDINDNDKRVVWSATGGALTHHNGSAQVFALPDGRSRVVWIADLLPNDAAETISQMMDEGMKVMKATLDRLPSKANV